MTGRPIATVFGGTGFVGHAVVQALCAHGYLVRVVTRDPVKAETLKVMGHVGQVTIVSGSLRSDAAAAEAMRDSEAVINLIGTLLDRGKTGYQSAHVEMPARLARMAKMQGVKSFVHLSALGADMKAKAKYSRTKAIGEEAVRAFFPDAVILRPSVIFGPRDAFFNRFALMARFLPFLPLIGGGHTKFQPVYVGDVASAILAVLTRPACAGQVYLLGGPDVYSYRDLMGFVMDYSGYYRWLVPVPWGLANLKAFFLELLPEPPLTRDQIELLKTDNILPDAPRHPGMGRTQPRVIEDLGFSPVSLEDIVPSYLA